MGDGGGEYREGGGREGVRPVRMGAGGTDDT